MLRKIPLFCTLTVLLSVFFASISAATVEYDRQQSLHTESPPVDMAVSMDGKYTFVLTEAGKVLIYSAPGTLDDTIEVGKDVRRIAISPDGGTLFLLDSKDSAIQVLTLDFIKEIDIAGSPFKGPADAPVAVVVFADYQ